MFRVRLAACQDECSTDAVAVPGPGPSADRGPSPESGVNAVYSHHRGLPVLARVWRGGRGTCPRSTVGAPDRGKRRYATSHRRQQKQSPVLVGIPRPAAHTRGGPGPLTGRIRSRFHARSRKRRLRPAGALRDRPPRPRGGGERPRVAPEPEPIAVLCTMVAAVEARGAERLRSGMSSEEDERGAGMATGRQLTRRAGRGTHAV